MNAPLGFGFLGTKSIKKICQAGFILSANYLIQQEILQVCDKTSLRTPVSVETKGVKSKVLEDKVWGRELALNQHC